MNKILFFIGLLAIVLISGCIQKVSDQGKGGSVVGTAMPIANVIVENYTLDSKENVKDFFERNYESIISSTKSTIIADPAERFSPSVECLENRTVLSQFITVEKRKWNYDNIWIGSGDEEKFVIKLPVVSENDKWKYENGKVLISYISCKNPTELMVIDENTGKAYCSSGTTESWKESGYLKFLMDDYGTIYFAGGYCLG